MTSQFKVHVASWVSVSIRLYPGYLPTPSYCMMITIHPPALVAGKGGILFCAYNEVPVHFSLTRKSMLSVNYNVYLALYVIYSYDTQNYVFC